MSIDLSCLVNDAFLELRGLRAKFIVRERLIGLEMAVDLFHDREELLNVFFVFASEYFL